MSNKSELITSEYQGIVVSFTSDGWFNATSAAEKFGKRIDHWLANQETKEYITVLSEILNTRDYGDLVKTKKGKNGGTWLHPRLGVPFARWLDVRFSIWCDDQIYRIVSGYHPHYDWKKARHEASASFKVMNSILDMSRKNVGKETKFYHYCNEAKLVNRALTGEYKGLDRDSLQSADLDLLARLEELNGTLIGCGQDTETRKAALEKYASDWRIAHQPAIDYRKAA